MTPSETLDWRVLNEPLLKPDDCRECSGMGRVPTGTIDHGFMTTSRYGNCSKCKGIGKMTPTEGLLNCRICGGPQEYVAWDIPNDAVRLDCKTCRCFILVDRGEFLRLGGVMGEDGHQTEKFHHDYEGKIVRELPKGGSSTSPPKQDHVAILLRKLAKGIFDHPSQLPNTEQGWYEFLSELK